MIHPNPSQNQPLCDKIDPVGKDDQAGVGPLRGHPGGRVKHGLFKQVLRVLQLTTWFNLCCFVIHTTQFICSPLYLVNRTWFNKCMIITKQQFGILAITVTQWFCPTIIRISGDKSVRGQLEKTKDGRLETHFPERIVLIANHQIYTEWLYLWWIAYTSKQHGAIYIILKETLKYIPIIGPAMMFYGFIFMARNWTKDKLRLQYRLKKLKEMHSGILDPMWLLIFPEGTNLSGNTHNRSETWAKKQGIQGLRHLVLPRSTGLLYCLQELRGTVDWIYDCTIAYEGTPRGQYAQDIFTLRSTFLEGRPPKSVNMYWRRIAMSAIPLDDPKEFEAWLIGQWREKDSYLEQYAKDGRFHADSGVSLVDKTAESPELRSAGYIETEVKLVHWGQIGWIFFILVIAAILSKNLADVWNAVTHGTARGYD